ncbi:hypothetical protein ASB1_18330 (plasmid) [Helicobacter heilmannii]|uniref:Uncharacterized protein n=1 Tax=Helicobacter heilmannii TaxID=35817 RepID=A0A0K2YCB3_HELHE|nr:hypothetical protein [Helicobacter heilmannii]BDQ28157.1 hypothetical protein ASB1_18330 [Helicobacter heilmannii]CCM12447.1 hypothetical protein BN341_p180 [Helicobacter heilmannii ASB1.4]CRI35349.1 hypothetical protein HHE01_00130 [Helicobacter heilmannii]
MSKASKDNKTLTVSVRFTHSELEQLKHKAQELGLDVSKYVRSCALKQGINPKQSLDEKVLTQIQEAHPEQETKHKKLAQKLKIWQISTIVLTIALIIAIAVIIFLIQDKQEPQIRTQSGLHSQENTHQQSSRQSQLQGQEQMKFQQPYPKPQEQIQTKQTQPHSQTQELKNPQQDNAQTQEQASPKEQTACQKYKAMEKMWKDKKEREVGWMKNLGSYTDCLREWYQSQPTGSPKENKSKTPPLQTTPDIDILKDLEKTPSAP